VEAAYSLHLLGDGSGSPVLSAVVLKSGAEASRRSAEQELKNVLDEVGK
jgi:hypothetical protein